MIAKLLLKCKRVNVFGHSVIYYMGCFLSFSVLLHFSSIIHSNYIWSQKLIPWFCSFILQYFARLDYCVLGYSSRFLWFLGIHHKRQNYPFVFLHFLLDVLHLEFRIAVQYLLSFWFSKFSCHEYYPIGKYFQFLCFTFLFIIYYLFSSAKFLN